MTETSHSNLAQHASLKSYITGFAAAVVLTIIAFMLVFFGHTLPRWGIISAISIAALAQVLVHLYFFLHLDFSRSQRWNLLTLLFTVVILIIFVGGTIWVISDLNYRMM